MSDAALLYEACAVLDIDRSASIEQVRAAWKRKLKTVHPDVGGTKEAVHQATNMRDVLLAWIEAGRPDLDAEPGLVRTYARARSRARDCTWEDVAPPHPADMAQPRRAGSWNGFWTVAVIWGLALMSGLLVGGARKDPRPIWTHARPFLPVCVTDAMREILKAKCPALRPVAGDPEFAKAPHHLPICMGMDIFEETRAMINGTCWPASRH